MLAVHRLIIVASVLAFGLLSTSGGSAGAARAPVAPVGLSQNALGAGIPVDGWSRTQSATFAMRVTGTGGWLRAQVELRKQGHAFTGRATNTGNSDRVPNGATATLTVSASGLENGVSYLWQARVIDAQGMTSAWVPFTKAAVAAFRIDTVPPSIPRITSTTNPKWGAWSRETQPVFRWSSSDAESGIAGYSYSFGRKVHAPRPPAGQSTTGTFKDVPNGKWVLHVWARDVAGNWSALGYYKFNVDHTAPKISYKGLTATMFNPLMGTETWTFSLASLAKVSVEVDRTGRWKVMSESLGLLKKGEHTFVWNGKGAKGHVVPAGWYWIRIYTTDKLGNQGNFPSTGIHVNPFKPTLPFYPHPGKHIVVSLTKEAIYAYNGDRLVTWSLATTGNPALPTPTGHFAIFARFTPFEFISPWPQGSPYYYPPSWVTYAMEFIGGGYFIHDAPWRSVFGPGSDGPGTPGTNYGGTHGCVNVPFNMAKFLFGWAPNGTPVDVLP
ncbi:MAG TPA: L,D-transpeptidase family protein [Chloroflexota bacterium]|nr:L,D-transpeptidase family protein [Chloroflexota bacterium]